MKRLSQKTHDIYDHGVASVYVISIVMVTEANKVGYIRGVLIAPSTGV
jgi:DNA polymerase III alpha subunit (gram-positive type)